MLLALPSLGVTTLVTCFTNIVYSANNWTCPASLTLLMFIGVHMTTCTPFNADSRN